MRPLSLAFLAAVCAAAVPGAPSAAATDGAPRTQDVQFAKGASSTRLSGSIQGSASVDYVLAAKAGQTLTAKLKTANASAYFNVLPPGSQVAMFIGSTAGSVAELRLPTDGRYVVRVYLMRSAARRNETARYTLDLGVAGQALPALSARQDAPIPGTPYHASASLPCSPPGAEPGGACQAFVIRRGRDGTATVEVRRPWGLRRVLFVRGEPVASDAVEPVTATRDGDRLEVRIGSDERYVVPDALLTGG